jgi:hypothetical protein
MQIDGLDPNDNAQIARWWRTYCIPPAHIGAAVVTIDHVAKSKDSRGRWGIGGQHKLAAISGAAYTVETITPFTRGKGGAANINVSKDRPGMVRELADGKHVAVFRLNDEGQATISAPVVSRDAEGNWHPSTLMAKVSEYLAAIHPAAATAKDIEGAVTGKGVYVRAARDSLAREGYAAIGRDGWTHIKHFDGAP